VRIREGASARRRWGGDEEEGWGGRVRRQSRIRSGMIKESMERRRRGVAVLRGERHSSVSGVEWTGRMENVEGSGRR
jgi:hypothetical protein